MDLDEVAHLEPPHQDLRCLQIQLFSSLVLKELKEQYVNHSLNRLLLTYSTWYKQFQSVLIGQFEYIVQALDIDSHGKGYILLPYGAE